MRLIVSCTSSTARSSRPDVTGMRVLERKMLRDLWQIRWRALAVALTVASGVGIYAGTGMAIATGFHTRDVLFQRMGFAELEVQFLPEDVTNLPDLTAVPGVHAIERRLVLPGTVFLPDHSRIAGVLVFLETVPPTIDALEIAAGGPLRAGDFESAVVERSLATFHGFGVGDRIRVQVGEKTYESRIDGVVISPEWLIVTANPDYFVPEKGSVGVVFTSLTRVSDALGFTMVNDLLFRLDPGADARAVKDAVITRVGRLNLERVIAKEEHFIWRHMQLTLEAFQVYVPSLVLMLGSLSFVLTFITVHRLVLDQRKEIGALLALGYGRRRLLGAYLTAGALLGSGGGVIGIGLAFVFRNLYAATTADAIGLQEVIPVVVPRLLAVGFAAAVIGTMAAAALPVARMLRLPPQAIIRAPVSERAGFEAWMRWTRWSMARFPLPVRFGLRNMIRRPGRTLSTILAIGFSLGVAIAYVMSLTSALQTSEQVFAREGWDLTVDFLYPVPLEDLAPIRALSGVTRVEPYFRRFAEIGVGGRYESVKILGVPREDGMKRTVLKAGRALSGRADELLVSQDLARRLGSGSVTGSASGSGAGGNSSLPSSASPERSSRVRS
ncbi:MAG: FtsX-like permease family protein [Candidatus Rokubacteria bacterium]|nr:FtsX-like permease family protein [Candidatus Rokubacteria bacterium]